MVAKRLSVSGLAKHHSVLVQKCYLGQRTAFQNNSTWKKIVTKKKRSWLFLFKAKIENTNRNLHLAVYLSQFVFK